ncbi:hypothetical protein P3S67_012880 [Capsicum chacoense]
MAMQASQVYFEMYPTVKKIVSEWLDIFQIKARSVVDVPKQVVQPHTLNDLAFQENNIQIHEIDIDENEILNTLNGPDGMLIDLEEKVEKEGDGRENDEDEDEDEDEDKDKDKDNNEDDDHDDDDEQEEEEEEECELHKKKIRKI